MKRLLPLLVVLVLAACNGPKPTVPLITPPAVSPSLVPSIVPALIPSVIPSPSPATAAPTSEPTREPDQPVSDSILLPTQEALIDLGLANFEGYSNPRPLALDAEADRLYVSLSPTRTVVLAADSLTPVAEIPVGGTLSVDPQLKRLYIGVPGAYRLNPDGTGTTTPAELQLFDTTDLSALRRLTLSNTLTVPPLVEIDPQNQKVYLTQEGVTLIDATTLAVQGTLSGTFPIPQAPVPNYSAVDAAIDPQRQRLFVSLNNGIPGSNNGNVLQVYDLTTGQVINQDLERSALMMALDPQTGVAIVPHAHIATYATTQYDAQGNIIKRLDGASGWAQIDPQHDRVYLLDGDVKVFDRDLNFLGMTSLPEGVSSQGFIVDAERDRLLILQNDGYLRVLQGQGQSIGAQQAEARMIPEQYAVLSIQPSPATDQLFASFAPDEFTRGYGAAFRSGDAGATWKFVAGLPRTVTDLQSADRTLYAALGGNGTTSGYGIWRSDNDGQTWLPASHGLTDLGITHLAVSPDFARDGTLFALSKRGVFRSIDRGATWTSLADRYAPLLKDLTVTFNAVALSPNFASDHTLLIGHTSGLWRSTDRGETWTSINGGPAATRLAFAPDGSIVLAAAYDGVHRSTDGGLTWQAFNAGLDLSNSTVSEVQINDREAVVLLTSFDQPGAIYRLPLHEATWQRAPIDLDVTALALQPNGSLLIGTADGRVQRLD